MEIGSEFWLEKLPEEKPFRELPRWLTKFGDSILTTSGRGAITLLLQNVKINNKSVLMPSYICDSVILPFIEQGYTCYFYELDNNFSPLIKNIEEYKNIGIFIHMGYYGFQTNSCISDVLRYFKGQSTIIVEDVTHTLFSRYKRYKENDFYIGSIRKWFGVPSGGFLASSKNYINNLESTNLEFSLLRSSALITKGKYIKTNDKNLKIISLKQFSNAEEILDNDLMPYRIDPSSINLIISLDDNYLFKKRRENFNTLSRGLESISFLENPFKLISKNECPMFYPILIKNNRNEIRAKLIDERIYCPIHWPVPRQINLSEIKTTSDIYSSILSIPCDQRYGRDDMERIITVIKNL